MRPHIRFFIIILLIIFIVENPVFAGNCLSFDRGQRQWVSIDDSESLDIDGREITMEAWINIPNPNEDLEFTIWNKENSYEAHVRNGLFQVAIFTDRWAWQGQNTQIRANEWTHVAGTYDGQSIRLYINGNLRSTIGKQGNIQDTDSLFFIGTRPLSNFIHCYDGMIDEVRIWEIMRTQQEIEDNMNCLLSGNEEGLVGYWRMDEGEGQTLHDMTPNENHGILGTEEEEDDRDAEWCESEAPIDGGELTLSRYTVHFQPQPVNQSHDEIMVLTNLSEGDDENLAIRFEFIHLDEQPDWLNVSPLDGAINPGNDTEITFSVSTEGIEPGEYDHTLLFSNNAVNLYSIEIPVSVIVVAGAGRLYGRVTDPAENNQPIAGALVQVVADFEMQQITDDEGRYDFGETPVFNYHLLCTHENYLPMEAENVEVNANEETELDFDLLYAMFEPDPEWIDHELEAEESVDLPLTISNSGNGPLAWSMERRFPEEVQADPWDIRGSANIEEMLNDSRLNGVVFVNGYFYITGGDYNGDEINKVYVLNHDGELVREFDQFHESRYGMRDITWDGQLLWSGDDDNDILYGFTTDGNLITSMETDAGSYRSLAWDPQHDRFWTANISTNIIGIDIDGQMQAQIARPQGMSIYGLAYWTDDPDGYNLYIFSRGDETDLAVYKANIDDGDIIFVTEMNFNGGRFGGTSVTNCLDPYSWLLVSMVQNPDHLVVWHLASRTDWLLVNSFEGVIDAGDGTELTVTLSSEAMPGGTELSADLCFTHDGRGGSFELPVTLSVAGGGGELEQRTLSLHDGWNLISVNVEPENDDVRELMRPLVEEDLLLLVKDQYGHFYYPRLDYCNIDGWVSLQGYQMKLVADFELTIEGTPIAWDTPIALRDGWNMVSYLPRDPVDARVALRNIADVLLLAKNGQDHFYYPRLDFNNIGNMLPGQGYQMKIDGDVQLVYNLDEEQLFHPSADGSYFTGFKPNFLTTVSSPPRRIDLSPTGCSYSLLLLTVMIEPGILIEAYTESGILAGRGIVGTDNMCGMALWGDDPTTDEINGFLEGEAVRLTISSNGSTNRPISVESIPVWTADGFGVIDVSVGTVPIEFGLCSVYPTPFNGMLRIEFALAQLGHATLKAYDLTGREVATIVNAQHTAGIHTTTWNAEGLPSGIYMLSLTTAGDTQIRKILLLK